MRSATWQQALGWRMSRQLLDPIGDAPVDAVVRRLGAVQAQNDAAGELSIRTRRRRSRAGEVAEALADGRLIKTFAFRGATHLMAADDAGVYLALRGSSRMWELPSWRAYYRLDPADWPAFRDAVRAALADGPLTRTELGAAVTADPRFRHLGFAFGEGSGTLLKPLAWLGEMSFGPARDGHSTLQRLVGNPHWTGLPHIDEAGPRAVEAYLGAYGPATVDHLRYWLGSGLGAGGRRIDRWISDLGAGVASVTVDETAMWIRRRDLDALFAAAPSSAVRLLPAYDQWVLGAGTADTRLVSPARRALLSRGASPVIDGGVISGTWSVRGDTVMVSWFGELGKPPTDALAPEAERLATILGRSLDLSVAAS